MSKFKFTKNWLKSKFSKPKVENLYYGLLIKKSAVETTLEDGHPIITHDGDMGRIVKFYGSIWMPGKEKWLDVKLDNKSYKHCHISSVNTLHVLFPIMGKSYPLSHSCYRFIKPDDIHNLFEFRITNRGYAMLSENEKESRQYIAIFRRSRYGASFLHKLESIGFKIIKN